MGICANWVCADDERLRLPRLVWRSRKLSRALSVNWPRKNRAGPTTRDAALKSCRRSIQVFFVDLFVRGLGLGAKAVQVFEAAKNFLGVADFVDAEFEGGTLPGQELDFHALAGAKVRVVESEKERGGVLGRGGYGAMEQARIIEERIDSGLRRLMGCSQNVPSIDAEEVGVGGRDALRLGVVEQFGEGDAAELSGLPLIGARVVNDGGAGCRRG